MLSDESESEEILAELGEVGEDNIPVCEVSSISRLLLAAQAQLSAEQCRDCYHSYANIYTPVSCSPCYIHRLVQLNGGPGLVN